MSPGAIGEENLMKFLVAILAAISFAAGATPVTWDWSWKDSAATVVAHGSLTTAGDATVPEPAVSITGEIWGVSILGLVPVGVNPHYGYDDLFQSTDPFVDGLGLLLELQNAELAHFYDFPFFFGPSRYFISVGGNTERVFPEFVREEAAPSQGIPEPGTLGLVAFAFAFAFVFGTVLRRRA